MLGALPLGVKWPGREADRHLHLVPRSKNEWSYTPTPQYAFIASCSVKMHRKNFPLSLPLPSPGSILQGRPNVQSLIWCHCMMR
jgi:hypothetical protein